MTNEVQYQLNKFLAEKAFSGLIYKLEQCQQKIDESITIALEVRNEVQKHFMDMAADDGALVPDTTEIEF